MQSFLRDFYVRYSFAAGLGTLNLLEFRNFWWNWVFNHVSDPFSIINSIDFNKWVNNPGMPATTLNFDNEMYQ